jgi:hypothetical protein
MRIQSCCLCLCLLWTVLVVLCPLQNKAQQGLKTNNLDSFNVNQTGVCNPQLTEASVVRDVWFIAKQ